MKAKPWVSEFLRQARVAHLATSKDGSPHVIPICFAFDGKTLYSSLDEKPKRANPRNLRRVRNIITNPRVSMIVDLYSENWQELRYVIVQGTAEIVYKGKEHEYAIGLLREKYPQYRHMKLEGRPVIRLEPERLIGWAASSLTS